MKFFFSFDQSHFDVLPALGIGVGQCACCETPAGIVVHFSWAFWTFGVLFTGGHSK